MNNSSSTTSSQDTSKTGSTSSGTVTVSVADVSPVVVTEASSLSNDQLLQLLLHALHTQQQLHTPQLRKGQLDATSQLAIQPFTATPVLSIQSLYHAFPFVEEGTILEITRHEFRPMDLRKLDSELWGKELSLTPSSKDYPSLSALVAPLTLYFRVLVQFAVLSSKLDVIPILASGGLSYIEYLHRLNHRFEWTAVLRYHMAFHNRRRREMIHGVYDGWGQPDLDLMSLHLWGHERARRATMTSTSDSSTKPKRLPIEQQTCFAFNSGSCTTSHCKRMHQCSKCQLKGHGRKACQ